MTIKSLLAPNKNSIWLAVFWTVLILYFSFKSPSGEKMFYFPNADKVVHFVFYFVFVIAWFRYLVFEEKQNQKSKILLVSVAILLGISVEIGQTYLTTSRQGDILDALANSIGGITGILVSSKLFELKKNNI
ncbi:VanZ family protein [Flavobacterium sp.]|uniref:VanZ family protein n=1 Tax=Flavobacterium sp. TaxID=239 RepID=UPI003D6A8F77